MLGAYFPSSTHLYEKNAESIAWSSYDILTLPCLSVPADSRNSILHHLVVAISAKALTRFESLKKLDLNESEAAVLSHRDNGSILRDKWGLLVLRAQAG